MKRNSISVGLLVATLFIGGITTSCKKNKQDIHWGSTTGRTELPNDLQAKISNGNLSPELQAVVDALTIGEQVSSVPFGLDVDGDETPDLTFEIIDLHLYNNDLPPSLDSSAARVIPNGVEILDNSTWKYCDALDGDALIDGSGNWTDATCVLGTFANAGQFQGAGFKHLAFRKASGSGYKYGWVKLSCDQTNELVEIDSYGINQTIDGTIDAGQTQ